MEYRYKPTTNGLAAMAAYMALGTKPFNITRVAFGCGLVDKDTNLADVHELVEYVSDGTVGQRSHENDRFNLTIQYANDKHKEVKTFLLTEFIVYVEDPVNGGETDLFYGTMGDYRQPVPAYNPAYPPSVFNFPLVLVLSNEVNVIVSAPAGLVTYEELADITAKLAIRYIGLAIPASGWVKDGGGRYPYRVDVPVIEATSVMIPFVTVMEQGEEIAEDCGLAPRAETVEGAVRFKAVEPPAEDILICMTMMRDSTGVVLAAPGTGGSLDLPVATEQTPGLVKPGNGLVVDKDGTMSIDMASEEDVEKMLDAANNQGEEEV